jgi:hypothetical protein
VASLLLANFVQFENATVPVAYQRAVAWIHLKLSVNVEADFINPMKCVQMILVKRVHVVLIAEVATILLVNYVRVMRKMVGKA